MYNNDSTRIVVRHSAIDPPDDAAQPAEKSDEDASAVEADIVLDVGTQVRQAVRRSQQRHQRRSRSLSRHVMRPLPKQNTHTQHFVVPDIQPKGLKGYYFRELVRQAAILRISGIRPCTAATLSSWSHGTQPLFTTTLFRYWGFVALYIDILWKAEQERQFAIMRAMAAAQGGRCLVLAADGSWSTRGTGAKQHVYVVVNVTRWRDPAAAASQAAATRLLSGSRDDSVGLPCVVLLVPIVTLRQVAAHKARRRMLIRPEPTLATKSGPTSVEVHSSSDTEPEEVHGKYDDADEGKEEKGQQGGGAKQAAPPSRYEMVEVDVKGYRNAGTWQARKGSAGMEGVAADQFIAHIRATGLMKSVQFLVTDGDLKISDQMSEHADSNGVVLLRDPGHCYKKIRHLLVDLFRKKQGFERLAWRTYNWIRGGHRHFRFYSFNERDEVQRNAAILKLMQCCLVQLVYHYHNLCDPATCMHVRDNSKVFTSNPLGVDPATLHAHAARWWKAEVEVLDRDVPDGGDTPFTTLANWLSRPPLSPSSAPSSSSSSSLTMSSAAPSPAIIPPAVEAQSRNWH